MLLFVVSALVLALLMDRCIVQQARESEGEQE